MALFLSYVRPGKISFGGWIYPEGWLLFFYLPKRDEDAEFPAPNRPLASVVFWLPNMELVFIDGPELLPKMLGLLLGFTDPNMLDRFGLGLEVGLFPKILGVLLLVFVLVFMPPKRLVLFKVFPKSGFDLPLLLSLGVFDMINSQIINKRYNQNINKMPK